MKNQPENKHPNFTGRNVPTEELAKAMNKSPQFVRVSLQLGLLKCGYAKKFPGNSKYSYFCPDRKVWEEIGYYNPNPLTKKSEKEKRQ